MEGFINFSLAKESMMRMSNLLAAVSFPLCCLTQSPAVQAAPVDDPVPFKKENVYGGWSKDLFADAAVVQGPHKTIYVAGMASENPESGRIDHLGDFSAQCAMAYGKIRKILVEQGADMNSIVRTVAYVTDMRYLNQYVACQKDALGGAALPPHTMLNVNRLAWPGMMVEVEVTAVVPEKR
ncbi:RidA family protein [Burkholderia ubonensis]|uniref:RidA family protein n=1 Tax=Burkholderia ubonensis TaxID=101571 RepID=UPI000A8833E7|nr:RidA family protein [Burkholderia ubonensis]